MIIERGDFCETLEVVYSLPNVFIVLGAFTVATNVTTVYNNNNNNDSFVRPTMMFVCCLLHTARTYMHTDTLDAMHIIFIRGGDLADHPPPPFLRDCVAANPSEPPPSERYETPAERTNWGAREHRQGRGVGWRQLNIYGVYGGNRKACF